MPAALINDARAFGLAELRLGAGRGASLDDRADPGDRRRRGHRDRRPGPPGHDGTAGELGHQTIDPNGPSCGCGNRGCLEAFARADQIARRAGRRRPRRPWRAARAGDARAVAGLRRDRAVPGHRHRQRDRRGVARTGSSSAAASPRPVSCCSSRSRRSSRRRVMTTALDGVSTSCRRSSGTWAGAIGAAVHGADGGAADAARPSGARREPTPPLPHYRQIEHALRERIATLRPGERLPSDAELSAEFGVSRMTARNAMQRLADEGSSPRPRARDVRGRAPDPPPRRPADDVHPGDAPPRPRAELAVSSDRSDRRPRTEAATSPCRPGARGRRAAAALRRRRPIAIETAVLVGGRPRSSSPPTWSRLAPRGRWAGRDPPPPRQRHDRARPPAPTRRRLFGVAAGSPLLVERRVIADVQGRPIEATESRYPWDRYALDVRFEVEGASRGGRWSGRRSCGRLVRRDGVVAGAVTVEDGWIAAVDPDEGRARRRADLRPRVRRPPRPRLRRPRRPATRRPSTAWRAPSLRRGVTWFLPTAASLPPDATAFTERVRAWTRRPPTTAPSHSGSTSRARASRRSASGAHDPALLRSPAEWRPRPSADPRRHRGDHRRARTARRPRADRAARGRGVVVSLGHTAATLEEAQAGYAAGAHVHDPPVQRHGRVDHRAPGLAVAAARGRRVRRADRRRQPRPPGPVGDHPPAKPRDRVCSSAMPSRSPGPAAARRGSGDARCRGPRRRGRRWPAPRPSPGR